MIENSRFILYRRENKHDCSVSTLKPYVYSVFGCLTLKSGNDLSSERINSDRWISAYEASDLYHFNPRG